MKGKKTTLISAKEIDALVKKALEPQPRKKGRTTQLQDLESGELFIVTGCPHLRGRLRSKGLGSAQVTYFDKDGHVDYHTQIALSTEVTRRKRLKGVGKDRATKGRAMTKKKRKPKTSGPIKSTTRRKTPAKKTGAKKKKAP